MVNVAILGVGDIAAKMASTLSTMITQGDQSLCMYSVASRDGERARRAQPAGPQLREEDQAQGIDDKDNRQAIGHDLPREARQRRICGHQRSPKSWRQRDVERQNRREPCQTEQNDVSGETQEG